MARAKAVENKPKQKVRFYAQFLRYSFDYNAVDENGKQKYLTNPATGQQKYDNVTGEPIPIHKSGVFKTLSDKMSKGYLSYFEFDPSDESAQNQELGKALFALAQNKAIKVETQEAYDLRTNPEKAAETARVRALQSELEAKEEVLSSKDETIAALEAKLKALEK